MKPGQSFSELAVRNSDHESAPEAGYLGTVAPGEYGIEFERAIRSMKTDEISMPFRTLRGYTIVKLWEKDGPYVPPFAQISDALRNTLVQKKRFELMENEVFKLAEKADIEVRLYGFKFGS
jgi:parvulin-like peptidyl-prolyl isomerase